MKNINLELYRIFYMVANSQSITKAAKELYISQPAVSQAIKQLESQLGGKLFVRSRRGMSLTHEGQVIYEYVKEATTLLNTAEMKFTQLKELCFGEIKICASDSITSHLLLDKISNFSKKYQDVNINIVNRTTSQTVEQIKTGKSNIGFIHSTIKDSSIKSYKCFESKLILIGSENQALKYKNSKMDIQDLLKERLISLESISYLRQKIDKNLLQLGIEIDSYMELGSLDLIAKVVAGGFGMAIVPDYMLNSISKIKPIDTNFDLSKISINMIVLNKIPLNHISSKFLEMFKIK